MKFRANKPTSPPACCPFPLRGLSRTGFVADSAAQAELAFLRVFGWSAWHGAMFTILGAGGAIGNELVKQLAARSETIRLVGRNAKLVPGATETIAADLSNLDDTLRAVSGSRIVFSGCWSEV